VRPGRGRAEHAHGRAVPVMPAAVSVGPVVVVPPPAFVRSMSDTPLARSIAAAAAVAPVAPVRPVAIAALVRSITALPTPMASVVLVVPMMLVTATASSPMFAATSTRGRTGKRR
jgi:hypothetical protein